MEDKIVIRTQELMMIEKMSLRQKSAKDLAERTLLFKRTLRQWFYFAGIRYMQTHKLTDNQELTIENFTDFIVEFMDDTNSDEFIERAELN